MGIAEDQVSVGEPLPAAWRLAEAIAARELSCVELVEACLERIAAEDADLRAWSFVDADGARAQARGLDGERPRGPLHGLPVGVKDIIDVAGLPCELGSPIHAGRVARRDADAVARLRAAGAIVLGKTVTTEFATWTPPPTRNPVRPDRTPGGSSSGSAAAVAAGMAPLALGTQTVGSTIRPAAFCGIAGLKPTHGVASLRGVMLHSDELDTLGLMARDARSLAALWRAVAGAPAAAAPLSRPPRVAAVRTPWWDRAGDASRRAFERAADALRAGGAQVRERTLPPGFAAVSDAHRTVTEHDVARGLASHAEDPRLSPLLRVLVERGLAVSAAERAAAVETGRAAARDLEPLWAEFDALLVPAVVGEAPPAAEGTGDAIHCVPWSLLGTPAVTVPAGVGPEGLPVGIQLVAPRGRDLALLEVAALVHA